MHGRTRRPGDIDVNAGRQFDVVIAGGEVDRRRLGGGDDDVAHQVAIGGVAERLVGVEVGILADSFHATGSVGGTLLGSGCSGFMSSPGSWLVYP